MTDQLAHCLLYPLPQPFTLTRLPCHFRLPVCLPVLLVGKKCTADTSKHSQQPRPQCFLPAVQSTRLVFDDYFVLVTSSIFSGLLESPAFHLQANIGYTDNFRLSCPHKLVPWKTQAVCFLRVPPCHLNAEPVKDTRKPWARPNSDSSVPLSKTWQDPSGIDWHNKQTFGTSCKPSTVFVLVNPAQPPVGLVWKGKANLAKPA